MIWDQFILNFLIKLVLDHLDWPFLRYRGPAKVEVNEEGYTIRLCKAPNQSITFGPLYISRTVSPNDLDEKIQNKLVSNDQTVCKTVVRSVEEKFQTGNFVCRITL